MLDDLTHLLTVLFWLTYIFHELETQDWDPFSLNQTQYLSYSKNDPIQIKAKVENQGQENIVLKQLIQHQENERNNFKKRKEIKRFLQTILVKISCQNRNFVFRINLVHLAFAYVVLFSDSLANS